MNIDKTYTFGGKAVIISVVAIFALVALIGYFFGNASIDSDTMGFFKTKIVDADFGHAVFFLLLCYGFFGK